MTRITASGLMGFDDSNRRRRRMTPAEEDILALVRLSFRDFLHHWRFKNRETGEILTMAALWPGQERFAELMATEKRILALKAGKLGFTELECAWDAWVALFGQPNARVHLFSKDAPAAQALLEYVQFGITHLPWFMQLPIVSRSNDMIRLEAGPDDIRTIVSYAASPGLPKFEPEVDDKKCQDKARTTVLPTICRPTRRHGVARYAARRQQPGRSAPVRAASTVHGATRRNGFLGVTMARTRWCVTSAPSTSRACMATPD